LFELFVRGHSRTSTVNAGPHRGGGNGNRSAPDRRAVACRERFCGNRFAGGGNRIGNWNGQRFSGQRFAKQSTTLERQHWSNNHGKQQLELASSRRILFSSMLVFR